MSSESVFSRLNTARRACKRLTLTPVLFGLLLPAVSSLQAPTAGGREKLAIDFGWRFALPNEDV
jgi:hypothetical protein